MKSLSQLSLIILMALLFTQCTKEESSIEPIVEATIIGEWKIEGFENIRYHFTEDKRYAIYADTIGEWPTLAEWITENPNAQYHNWQYEGDKVVIDLNFGNIIKLTPEFRCNNNVISWNREDDNEGDKYYRAEHDLSSCN